MLFLQRVCNVVLYVLDGTVVNTPIALTYLNLLKTAHTLSPLLPPVCFKAGASAGGGRLSKSSQSSSEPADDKPELSLASMSHNTAQLRVYRQVSAPGRRLVYKGCAQATA